MDQRRWLFCRYTHYSVLAHPNLLDQASTLAGALFP